MNPKVDWYFNQADRWQAELLLLRNLVLAAPLTEELKWGVPCYTHAGGNVLLLHYFKNYCAVLFPQGALLQDPAGLLVQQTANTQAARQLRFTSVAQIEEQAATLAAYVQEALALEQAGRKVDFRQAAPLAWPAELEARMAEVPGLRAAFAALTPGRQRAYLLHFTGAKQSATRAARVEKCLPRILRGEGLND